MKKVIKTTKIGADTIAELCSLLDIQYDIQVDEKNSGRTVILDYDYMELDKKLKRGAGRKKKEIGIDDLQSEVKKYGIKKVAEMHNLSERTIYRRLNSAS